MRIPGAELRHSPVRVTPGTMSTSASPAKAEATAAADGAAAAGGAADAGANLTEALRKQIEFYFSRENLTQVSQPCAAYGLSSVP